VRKTFSFGEEKVRVKKSELTLKSSKTADVDRVARSMLL